MKTVGILYHPMIQAAHALAKKLEDFLNSKGVTVWSCSAWESKKAISNLDKTNFILSIGGDGTILRAVQVAKLNSIPVTGINLGKLGFMTELSTEDVLDKLTELLHGEGWVDKRMMLMAELLPNKTSEARQVFHALNDIVIARGAIARMINIETNINEQQFINYKADGIIIATATGSTGYSLAAGGPILHPHSEDILLIPILPHLSPHYPLVLPPPTTISLYLRSPQQATLCIDGHINLQIENNDAVMIKASPKKAQFLRLHRQVPFYRLLEQKLKGKYYVKSSRKG
jgi:NAD+ kinase